MDEKIEYQKRSRKIYLFFLIAVFIFSLDHALKILAIKNKCFIFCFEAVKNYGAAFSLFEQLLWAKILIIIISVAVLFLAAFFYFKLEKKLLRWALPLIFAGTLSNLLDRIFYGYVADYIPFFSKSLFTFNIADLANTIGVVLLIIYLVRKK